MSLSEETAVSIAVFDTDGATMVVLAGEIDVANIGELQRLLAAVPTLPPRHLLVDLGAVNFLGICAITALGVAAARLRTTGGTVALINASRLTQRVLHLLALDEILVSTEPINSTKG